MNKIHKELKSQEFLFTSYVYGFASLRPIIYVAGNKSTVVLAMYLLFFLMFFFVINRKTNVPLKSLFIWFGISIFFESQLIASLLFYDYLVARQYVINFFMYGVLPLLFLVPLKNFYLVVKYIVVFSLLNCFVLLLDPLNDYLFTGGYMEYGFNLLMYSFSGLLLGTLYLKKKILLIPLIVEFFFILIFGNKGAFFGAVTMLMVFFFYNCKWIGRVMFLSLVSMAVLEFDLIIEKFLKFVEMMNMSTYSLYTLQQMALKNGEGVYSVRTDIWNVALQWISESPLFGHGAATFDEFNNGYVHNVFLEVFVAYGGIGFLLFIASLVASIYIFCVRKKSNLLYFQIVTLLAWLIPMQFSLTIWNVAPFWIYWGLFFYNLKDVSCEKSASFNI